MTRALIPYAGSWATPSPYVRSDRMPRSRESRQVKARRMFKHGKDTFDIAEEMNVGEHLVLKWISRERDREYLSRCS